MPEPLQPVNNKLQWSDKSNCMGIFNPVSSKIPLFIPYSIVIHSNLFQEEQNMSYLNALTEILFFW